MKYADSETRNTMQQLAESSLARLRNWDIPDAQVKALTKTGEVKRLLTFRSPVSGIVTEKKAVQGMRFMPGETLYQVTDLSSVWVVADVFEQDIGLVRAGTMARVSINAYPGRVFEGRVTYVYPTLTSETRTVPVRLELANPGMLLKPAMFAQVELPVGDGKPVLAIPESAVIDSGTRRIVLVQLEAGRFEPREGRSQARRPLRGGAGRMAKASRSWSRPTPESTPKSNQTRCKGAWRPAAAGGAPGISCQGRGTGRWNGGQRVFWAVGSDQSRFGEIAAMQAMTMEFHGRE